MMPPGRRRSGALSALPLSLLAILFFTSAASAASAVLGIDLGNEYIKAALIKPGIPLDIVLSRDSKRKEAVAVAFKPTSSVRNAKVAEGEFPERLYGSDALALTARRPDDVYVNLKQLLGLPMSSEAVRQYMKRYPALKLVGEDQVGFESPSFEKLDVPFSVEEILAMELQNVRQNAQNMAGKGLRVDNVVFTIPVFWSADERRALELAADLAGLKVLGMVTDGVAVGINYATTRTFASINEAAKDGTFGKPELHMVFDMGAGSTRATVLKIQGRTVKDFGRFNKTITEVINLGGSWDTTLGGDSLNTIIVHDMITKFVDSSAAKSAGVSADKVIADGRVNAKLWKEAERLRQVLSANQQASASFESLFDDVDFRYKLERAQFEAMTKDFMARIKTPFTSALESAKISLADLDSIILHGGLVRTPVIQKQLEALVGGKTAKLKSNVNADEAAVFGAAFKAAGLSPSFRVKEIRDIDVGSFAAGIKYTVDGKQKSQKLFVETSATGAVKHFTVANKEDFDFVLFQVANTAARDVTKVLATNLTDSVKQLVDKFGCSKSEISTKLGIRLSPVNGLPEAVQGSVSCDVEDGKKGSIADNVKGLFGFGKKEKESQDGLAADDEGSSTSSATKSSSSKKAKGKKTSSTSSTASSDASQTPKMRTETIVLALRSEPLGPKGSTDADLKQIKARLIAFDKSDATRIERSDLLNSLEGLTYRVRDWLEDTAFTAYSSAAEQATLKQLSLEASEWIYGEGATAAAAALKKKLKGIEDIVNPIKKRREEALGRPEAVKSLEEALKQIGSVVNSIETSLAEQAAKVKEAAEAALSSGSEGASSLASEASESASTLFSGDEDTKTSTSTSSTPPSPTGFLPEWTEEDYSSLSSLYEETKNWLADKLKLQEKLGDTEDSAMLNSELASKARMLTQEVAYTLQKRMNAMNAARQKSKSKSTKTKKTKDKSSSVKVEKETSSAEAPQPTPGVTPEQSEKKEANSAKAEVPPEKPVPPHGEL